MAEVESGPRPGAERRAPPKTRPQGLDMLRVEMQRKLAQQIDLGLPDPFPPPQPVDPTFRPKAERQRLDSLRAEAQRNMTTQPEPRRGALFRAPGKGRLKPARLALVAVALLAGGLAAYLATHGTPAPQPPAQAVAEPAPPAAEAPTTPVLVAARTIAIGERLAAADLEWADWPQKAVRADYVTKTAAPDAMAQISGEVARFALFAGEPVRPDKLAPAGEGYLAAVLGRGMRAVSVSVTPEAASGGFIVPNDRVDVLVTRNTGAGPLSEIVVRDARVLAIGKTLGPAAGSKGDAAAEGFSGPALATLALDARAAQVLVGAAASGRLSLVLRSASESAPGAGADAEQAANAAIRLTSPFWTSGAGAVPAAAR